MKKNLILGLTALAFMVAAVPAGAFPQKVNARLDQKGNPVAPQYGGFTHMRNSGTSEMIVCSGRCLLSGLLMSTGPISSYVTIRNSSVAQGNGAKVIDLLAFNPLNTGPAGGRIPLDILLDKGISVTLSSVSNNQEVTVLYLDLNEL